MPLFIQEPLTHSTYMEQKNPGPAAPAGLRISFRYLAAVRVPLVEVCVVLHRFLNFTDHSNPFKTGGCCRRLNVLYSISRLSYVFHMCSEWTLFVKRTQCHFQCSLLNCVTRVPGCNRRDINPSCYCHVACFWQILTEICVYMACWRLFWAVLHTLDAALWDTENLLATNVHQCAPCYVNIIHFNGPSVKFTVNYY